MATPAAADAVADFYSGKQIKLIIRSGVGGSYDSYSRLLARHIGKHIPGNPTVVPKNMEGAGGLRLANFLYGAAPRDGTALGATSRSVAQIVFVAGMVTAFLTALYVARMLWLTFGAAYRGQGHPHEAEAGILVPLVVLAVGAALAGFVGLGDNSISTWIQTPLLPSEGPATLNLGLIVAATAVALLGLLLGTALYRRGLPEREYLERLPLVWTTLQHKYYLDDLYERGLVRAVAGALAPATYWFD